MAGKSHTAGGIATPKGLGDRRITSDSTVNKPLSPKTTKNGNGPRKQS